jgi:hypothetical protein
MITVPHIAIGASLLVFYASSLIVEIKSNPIIAKNSKVAPYTTPGHPCSSVVNGYIFELSN